MAFNMFPYSNMHELNLDWMLTELKDFSGQLDEFRTRLDTIREGILADCKMYTDAAIAEKYGEFQQQYNQLIIQIDQFQSAVNNTLKGFQEQFDDYKEQTTAEVLSAKAYTDVAIEQNNDYLLEEIQVVGIPGDGFGECGKGYFRFSAFGSPEDTREAADRLCKLLCRR